MNAYWRAANYKRYTEQIQRHKLYVSENGEDLPEVRNWKWTF